MTKREEYLSLSKKALGDKYVFLDEIEPLGQGGSGIVYVVNQVFGKDENIIAKRAVKFFMFRDDLMDDWGIVSTNNFRTEIKNITQFSHQNILKVVDGDFYNVEVNGKPFEIPYTVTEYIKGENLEDIFNQDKISLCKKYLKNEEIVFDIFLEIIDAVQYLHSKNFYHCDIAPKNIFLKTGRNKDIFAILGDLGAGNTISKEVTTSVRVIGTYDYMPEEVKKLKNQEISSEKFSELQPRWDIYSIIYTFRNVISKIKYNKIIEGNLWNLERLDEKLKKEKYKSVDALKRDIEYLKPSSGQILNLDELSEASSNIRPCLIPCGVAMLSNRMRKLTKHDGMLRLMEVPQLLEGATTFPGANHTRYEHSLGTYELMRRAILALLRNRDYITSLSERHVLLSLLGALLSSLANFPYSYAIQELRVQNSGLFPELERRKIFRMLINRPSKLSNKSLMNCIHNLFSQYDILEDDIEYVIFGKSDIRKKELDNLYSLLNSSIGVRVIDYILRDAHHIGISCRIETDNLFNNLAIINNEFCLKQGGISSAEQIITNRSWMFKRIYWSDPNRANAALLKYLFYIVYIEKKELDKLILENVLSFDCTKRSIQNILIENSSSDKKEQVKSIVNFINHKGQQRYKSILVLDNNSKYSLANQSCDKFFSMDYIEQYEIRNKLEKWFLDRYDIDASEINNGVILLIDIPAENMHNKLGRDIRVKRHDGMILELEKVSGLVNGMRANFEEQLRILRVYIRPDIYKDVLENKGYEKEEIGLELNQELCELL
ncbi:MAG: protein kinase [Lachnospiraceae bacterium]|nr:protein kinase [Lachnospiraceae bacterium]